LNGSGNAYVQSWGQGLSHDSLSSVRVGGLGAASFGRKLRVKIMDRYGRTVLDTVTWRINAQVSPDLDLSAPLALDSVGAVLIAID
jgi:hypothetical protein